MTTLPLSSIVVNERIRYEDEDIVDLAASIKRLGLLQPILVDQNNVLLAGFRRYTACKTLGWTEIPVHRRESLTESEYFEVELEENFRRKDFTWQETVASVCKIHRRRTQQAILAGAKWSQQMTGELLGGYSDSYVSNCLMLEPQLPALAECTTITDAVRELYRKKEDEAVAIQAARLRAGMSQDTDPFASPEEGLLGTGDVFIPASDTSDASIEVNLSSTCLQGDSIRDILPKRPDACVDHIITDWPFAINMSNIQQSSAGMDVSRTAAAHDVDENLELQRLAVVQFYRILRPGGFCVIWHDAMWFRWTHDICANAGFTVQRWPIVGCKPSAQNTCANINITKTTEQAIVMHKGVASLPKVVSSSWFFMPPPEEKLSNPFAKSFEAWAYIIEAVSIEGQTILDPFAGEGTCPLACLRLMRKPIAIEKDPTHYTYMLTSVRDWWQIKFPNAKFI